MKQPRYSVAEWGFEMACGDKLTGAKFRSLDVQLDGGSALQVKILKFKFCDGSLPAFTLLSFIF